MKRFFTLLLLLTVMFMANKSEAQKRYFDEIFDKVSVSTHTYGVNATILYVQVFNEAVPVPLDMDVYQPVGDTETNRPLVLVFHTGNFLPHPQNGSPNGTRKDSAVVDVCTKLAKKGYVVASCDYRLGWAPTATDKTTRVFTILNAVYRGVQDARTAIRFFKRDVNENANSFGIDPSKIVLWGIGTGGYITLNSAALDNYLKIPTASNGKFVTVIGGQTVPMVILAVNGDIYGTSVGVVPPGYPGFPAGDTLNYPNHLGYDSDFALCVNMGGALADTAWIDPGQVPLIAFHCPYDPNAPYKQGIVKVPVNPPLDVVEVQGSYLATKLSEQYGNNASFSSVDFKDPVSTVANTRNDGISSLYPIYGTGGAFDSSPWDFWASDNPNNANGLATNPNMSPEKARSYIDSILTFYAYRACYALDLDCKSNSTKDQLSDLQVGLKFGPSPAANQVSFTTNAEYPVKDVYVYDVQGRLVKAKTNINSNNYVLERFSLPSGNYLVNLIFKEGIVTKQITFK